MMKQFALTTQSYARRIFPKAAMCTVAAFILTLSLPSVAHASILGDWLNIDGWIKSFFLSIADMFFEVYFSLLKLCSLDSLITGDFMHLFGSGGSGGDMVWQLVSSLHQTLVIPLAESVLALLMLVQLVKISQKIDATATMLAIKEIVMLAVFYVIFHWLIVNSLDIVSAVFNQFNTFANAIANPDWSGFSAAFDISAIDANSDDVTIGSTVLLCLMGLLCILVGLIAVVITYVMAGARAIQLYVMAAFAPLPLSLLGFEETRSMGIGFLKNFCAVCLAGVIMLFLLTAFPAILMSTLIGSSSSLSTATLTTSFFSGDMRLTVLKFIAFSLLLILGLIKSGGWAKDILGG